MFNRRNLGLALAGAYGMLPGLMASGLSFMSHGPDHRTGRGRRTLYTQWNGSKRSRCRPVPGGGVAERARRVRQIAAGSLRVENGLVAE